VGEFHAAGISAGFIVGSASATDINSIESAGQPASVSGLIKKQTEDVRIV